MHDLMDKVAEFLDMVDNNEFMDDDFDVEQLIEWVNELWERCYRLEQELKKLREKANESQSGCGEKLR